MANFHAKNPDNPRFHSVLWNYSYNLPLGRFQKPGNWNDPDFIIGGDGGMSLAETRSQLALWSMMSAPLILSSDIEKLSPQAVEILGNKAVLAIDQDPLGKMATLVRRNPVMDVLFKKLSGGDYAIAVLNRGTSPIQVELLPPISALRRTRIAVSKLESLERNESIRGIHSPGRRCESRYRDLAHPPGAFLRDADAHRHDHHDRRRQASRHRQLHPLSGRSGKRRRLCGTSAETWTITAHGVLKSAGRCLAVADGKPAMQPCSAQRRPALEIHAARKFSECRWRMSHGQRLQTTNRKALSMQACGHNQPDQIWSLPN